MITKAAWRNLISFIVGFFFALGLAISGMTQPQKVIGFLNPWEWDPSLLFVMIGAVGIHVVSYPLIRQRSSPLLDTKWHVPSREDVTGRLILGSAIFGWGWGLGGFCPGPAIASLTTGDLRTALFVGTMILGMMLFKRTEPLLRGKK